MINGWLFLRLMDKFQSTSKRSSDASYSSTTSVSDSVNANQAQERMKRWLEESREKLAAAIGNANSSFDAKKLSIKKKKDRKKNCPNNFFGVTDTYDCNKGFF